MITITFDAVLSYLLVFVRMSGMLFLNPVLSRRNVPAQIRIALVLVLTMVIAPSVAIENPNGMDGFGMIGALLTEFLVGAVCAAVFQLFYYMLFFAGDLMDVEFGLSMAKIFDPGSSVQLSLSSSLLSVVFSLYLFVTDSHLLILRLLIASYRIVPAGMARITAQTSGFYLGLFSDVFSLAVRLTLPFVAALFVTEIAMGILMKLVPQIHVFVISIQVKITMGLVLLFLFAGPVTAFMDNYIVILLQSMEKIMHAMA